MHQCHFYLIEVISRKKARVLVRYLRRPGAFDPQLFLHASLSARALRARPSPLSFARRATRRRSFRRTTPGRTPATLTRLGRFGYARPDAIAARRRLQDTTRERGADDDARGRGRGGVPSERFRRRERRDLARPDADPLRHLRCVPRDAPPRSSILRDRARAQTPHSVPPDASPPPRGVRPDPSPPSTRV